MFGNNSKQCSMWLKFCACTWLSLAAIEIHALPLRQPKEVSSQHKGESVGQIFELERERFSLVASFMRFEPQERRETATGHTQQNEQAVIHQRAARVLLEGDKRAQSGLADDLREAVRKYEEACTLWREIHESHQLGVTLLHLGAVLRDLHNDERSEKCLSESLKLAIDAGDDDTKAEALMLLGMLRMRAGDLEKALELNENAFSISRQTGNRRLQSLATVYLAEIHFNSGAMQKAAEYGQLSLAIAKQLSDKREVGRALLALGYISTATQDNENALTFLAQSLSITRETNDLPGVVDALTMMGHQYSAIGEKQRALETYLNVESDAERLQDPERLARLYAGMDFVNEELSSLDQSLDYCRRSIKLYHDAGYSVGEFQRYERLGKLLFQTGDYEHALENYAKALSFFRQAGMKKFIYYVLSEIGEVYEAKNGIADGKALDYYTQASRLIQVDEDPREYSYVLNRIGRVTEQTKGPDAALVLYNEALKLNRRGSDLFGESATLFSIARAERQRDQPAEARAAIEAALQIDERIRDEVAVSDLRASYFATVNQHFDFYIDLLVAKDGANSDSNVAKALELSERKRSRTLLDEVAVRKLATKDGGDVGTLTERERKLKGQIEAKRDEYAKLKQDRGSTSQAPSVAEDLMRLSREYDQVRSVASSSTGVKVQYSRPPALTASQIQEVVDDEDTLLLEYSLSDEGSYLWAVTRGRIEIHKLPNRSEIENDVAELNRLVRAMTPDRSRDKRQASEAERQFRAQMEKLSAILLAPVSERLTQTRRIVIVPDGALQYVPFSVLPLPELNPPVTSGFGSSKAGVTFSPLMTTHEISLLPSVSVLVALRRRSNDVLAPPKSIAVIADPVFEMDDDRIRKSTGMPKGAIAPSRVPEAKRLMLSPAEAGGDIPVQRKQRSKETLLSQVLRDTDADIGDGYLPRLLATQFEAYGILTLTEPEQSFAALNFEASRQLLLSEKLKDYRIIHIATHGFLDNEHPELSGVVLSLYDQYGRPQNGFVQLRDIYDMKLNAEMVVLSACQTALGKNVKGEGITGLTRAFMFAGARRVVASLWKVDDSATAELMTSFYRHVLKERMTPSAALRSAQLEISNQRRWRQPFYWAGFFITGDFR